MKVLLHAPTAAALERARSNARDLRGQFHEGTVRIVASDDAVAAVLDGPDPGTDLLVILCRRALDARRLDAPAGFETTHDAGYLLASLQRKGWSYVRA